MKPNPLSVLRRIHAALFMIGTLIGAMMLLVLSGSPLSLAAQAAATPTAAPQSDVILLVSNATARHVSLVDPVRGVIAQIEVGASPWGMVRSTNGLVYVSTAEGVAVVDLRRRQRLALAAYRAKVGQPQYGEYRPGGMGLTISPDGKQVYVGIYLPNQSTVEILDTERLTITESVVVGTRPFDVVISPDGKAVYSIDHDSYSITVIDTATRKTSKLAAAPLGSGSYDKPHYAAAASDGRLWLPFQGRVLLALDPVSGKTDSFRLTADTHQHGIAFTPDGKRLVIVGTGAAGSAGKGPSLTIFDTTTNSEAVLALPRPHEKVAISPDGRYAYLTGGYLLPGGWNGLTIVDLNRRTMTELAVPDRPLDVLVLSAADIR